MTELYFIQDVPSKTPVSPIIACNSVVAALSGFNSFLKSNDKMDPRCYCLRKLPVVLDDSFNVYESTAGSSYLVCRGSDVEIELQNAINDYTGEE